MGLWFVGFRPAAAAWENHYADKLASVGFVRGLATPVSFYNGDKDVNLVVHGDDFTFVGEGEQLDWVEGTMKEWYEIRVRARLGPDEDDATGAVLLSRHIRWNDWGVSCEADPKHWKAVKEASGLKEEWKSLVAPGGKDTEPVGGDATKNNGYDCAYRSTMAMMNFMAVDMSDIQCAVDEACRDCPGRHSRPGGG